MKEIKIELLSNKAFASFGNFAHLINPAAGKLDEKPAEFFRDMVQPGVNP